MFVILKYCLHTLLDNRSEFFSLDLMPVPKSGKLRHPRSVIEFKYTSEGTAMKIDVLQNALTFEGLLDEETSISDLLVAHGKLMGSGGKPPIALDFSKVLYGNSAGIIIWIRYMREVKVAFNYINTPIWLIGQINMIKDFLANGSVVSSFQAPFFAPSSQESRAFVLEVGKDIPALKDYSDFKVPSRTFQGKEYENDFVPQRYLAFIAENYEQFKGIK